MPRLSTLDCAKKQISSESEFEVANCHKTKRGYKGANITESDKKQEAVENHDPERSWHI